MNTLLWIFLVTPWSLVGLLAWKLLHKTKIYGKVWLVTEKYLEDFDWSKQREDAVSLIIVRQTDIKEGELRDQVDANQSSGVDGRRRESHP